jgi:hypothetical protein
MPLRRYQRAASGPGRGCLATIPTFGQGDATLPGAFRPCRSSRLRRFAPLRASQGPRSWGPGSARAESAPIGVSPATDPGVHAVSAPAACPRSLDPSGCLSALGSQESGGRGLRVQVRPRSCPTLRSVPLVSSRPVVTDGRYLLAVAGRCAGRRRGCEPRRRLRWRLPASRPCSAAEVRWQGRCCQRSCSDASLGFILERAGGRCFRGHRADKPHRTAIGIGARVEPVYTRSIDRDPISMMERPVPA